MTHVREMQAFDDHGPDSYEQQCTESEIWISVDGPETHRLIRFKLQYSPKYKGRGLVKDIPSLGLRVGDRLEPTNTMLDVALFDRLKTFPTLVLFWRPLGVVRTHHRHPLLTALLGTGLHTFSIYVLHTLHFGKMGF